MIFQSTLSVRRATGAEQNQKNGLDISIHALRKESDFDGCKLDLRIVISIHALRKESDPNVSEPSPLKSKFQSTLSVRRATTSSTRP